MRQPTGRPRRLPASASALRSERLSARTPACSDPSATAQECTGSASCPSAGLPNRYISGVKIDAADPSHAYLALPGTAASGLSARTTPASATCSRLRPVAPAGLTSRGNLPDAPMNDILFERDKLTVASDVGVFTSSDNGTTRSAPRNKPAARGGRPADHRSQRHTRRSHTRPRHLDDRRCVTQPRLQAVHPVDHDQLRCEDRARGRVVRAVTAVSRATVTLRVRAEPGAGVAEPGSPSRH